MKPMEEVLTELFLKQDDTLNTAYNNRFSSFETKMQLLLESRERCGCFEHKVSGFSSS